MFGELPTSIARQLAAPAPVGGRHHQMCQLVKALLGAGWSPQEVFGQFRSMYPPDITEREIRSIIRWALARNPSPYRGACSKTSMNYYTAPCPTPSEIAAKVSIPQAIQNACEYLEGFTVDEADLHEASVVRLSEDFRDDTALVFSHLYAPQEYVCVNTDFRLDRLAGGELKPTISGPGVTHAAAHWGELLSRPHQERETAAGGWIRMNPVTEIGSGAAGAHSDSDVTAYRFILVEFDSIPLEIQLALLVSLYWPVAMICSSGGKSYHAWIRSKAIDADSYAQEVDWIYHQLAKYKVDTGNGNPSRFSRLPGLRRQLGAIGPGQQKLIYLNPNPSLEHPIL
jgi:hypothetical protein